jgi:hypothetical protein
MFSGSSMSAKSQTPDLAEGQSPCPLHLKEQTSSALIATSNRCCSPCAADHPHGKCPTGSYLVKKAA